MAIFATQNPQAGESSLGWSEAQSAAETRSRLASILGSLGSNDKLMFRGMYNLAGASITVSGSNLNIGAEAGAGLNITDPTATGVSRYFYVTGSNITIEDLTITAVAGYNLHKVLIEKSGGHHFTMRYCKVDCDLAAHVEFQTCADSLIEHCEFSNFHGKTSGRSPNDASTNALSYVQSDRLIVQDSYFHDMPHENIKTAKHANTGYGIRNPIIRRCFAKDIGRDFVDTTGGFHGSGPSARAILSDNIVINVSHVADFKFSGKNVGDYPIGDTYTKYVEMARNKVYNSGFITTTMTDDNDLLTTTEGPRYWRDAITEDILCTDNELQNLDRMAQIKLGLDIRFNNTIKRGTVGAVDQYNQSRMETNGPTSAAVAAAIMAVHNGAGPRIYTETGSTSTSTVTVPTTPSFAYGPRSGEAEPSSDPLFVLSGSSHRTNTDLGALSARTIMAGVENANGVASDSYTVTVS